MRTWMWIVAGASFSVGCIPLACTEIGCSGALELSFDQPTWEEGDYTLTVAYDGGEPTTCTFTVPLSGEQCGVSDIALDGTTLSVAVPTPMNDRLVEAEIRLDLNDAALLEQVVEPDWGAPFYPNGPLCDAGFGCLTAQEALTL